MNESSDVFQRLVRDATNGRPFSDIIVEWNTDYTREQPLKVLGGQHRVAAIRRAIDAGREAGRLHGLRVYFDLTVNQRVELVTIANSNIDIPNPLLDRIAEHQLGAGSRSWCQQVGLLDPGQDFTDRVAAGERMTVQVMRAFVTNYMKGREFAGDPDVDLFGDITIPGTGSYEPDKQYSAVLARYPDIWSDEGLAEAGRNFAKLHRVQVTSTEDASDATLRQVAFRYKALQPTVAAGWAFVAGLLHDRSDRLTLLYKLPDHYDKRTSKDPLNARAMSLARHTSDPTTYRGLGTRQNPAEAQKLAELFRLLSDPTFHNHITADLIESAQWEFQKKSSAQRAEQARRRAQGAARQVGTDPL
ncbi:MAG: hypothetical protein CVU47_10110 [Chloroflexi bacterium HGW-Chloroflexi-9]|nr:MAG: hypothetical protein CVU47_10110 [Chloroflexi bacterium HGW-Chloroflexi-9]